MEHHLENAEITAKSLHFYVFLNYTGQMIISYSKNILQEM